MKRNLTIIKGLTRIPSVGETEVGTAEVQPIRLCLGAGSARDSQLGYRRNVTGAVSQTRDFRISQNISEISPMPKKISLPKAKSLNRKRGFVQIYAEPIPPVIHLYAEPIPPVIHRDIKPQNILIGYDSGGMRVKVFVGKMRGYMLL